MNSSSIFDWLGLAAHNIWLYGGGFLLVLGVLVFIHEWGHYIVARLCGVKVDSFSIGFGPELFGRTDKNGTRWCVSLVPLGGYVKMFGDVDPASAGHKDSVEDKQTKQARAMTAQERSVAFFAQPVHKRAAIVFAGPAINFLFAIVVLAGLYATQGRPATAPVAAAVIGGSAAEKAGFLPHDEVIAIDGEQIRRFEEIKREVLVSLDQTRTFTVKRGEVIVDIVATPVKETERDHFGFKHSRGLLGLISPGSGVAIKNIKAVDGVAVTDEDQARRLLKARLGRTFVIQLPGTDKSDTLIVEPPAALNKGLSDPDSETYGTLVIAKSDEDIFIDLTPAQSVGAAVSETGNIVVSTLQALGQMITGTRPASELGGIIRIGAMAGDMAKSGMIALITFTALLSINLGLINLFPIPMLDGGHLTFYAIEAVKGSPISERIQEYAFRVGLALLVGIMLFANINDILQLLFRDT